MEMAQIPTGEKCELCGKPLMRYEFEFEIDGKRLPAFEPRCQCIAEREQAEHARQAKAGCEIVIQRRKVAAGLSKRQLAQTFDVFSPSPGQEKAHRAALDFVSGFATATDGKGLLFVGGVGSGKTHLAAAIANAVIEKLDVSDKCAIQAVNRDDVNRIDSAPKIKIASTVSLFETVRNAHNKEGSSAQDITQAYAQAALLILDDMGAEKINEWAAERMFEIIDHRYNQLLPTIITTNLQPEKLKAVIGTRIFDRIREMCLLVTVDAGSQRKTAEA